MKKYIIALYIRLSIEDSKTESLSIPNQRLILRERAMSLREWANAEILEFVDNGYSGTNFERPAVQELLNMVQLGKIDCIIVKDLSRFGRNSIETGYFIERVFPLYHTRFISVGDDFDTDNFKGDTGGIDVAFKYLICEFYSRDMSMKTRSSKYAKMRRGEYQSVICPYGYQKSVNGRMEIDENAAAVVKKIFRWAADGNSAAEITRMLYAQNIPTPGEYRAAKGKAIYDISRAHGVWCSSTVIRILDDERYIGTYVIGKREVNEIGSSRHHLKDESEWIKIPNHHPAIISKDIFEKAKSKLRRYSQPNKKQHEYLLKGKIFCGSCNHALSRTGKNSHYICRHSKVSENLLCYSLKISALELEQTIFDTLRVQLLPSFGIDSGKEKLDLKTIQETEYEKKLRALQDSKRQLYEKYVFGEIDLETYKTKKAEYDAALIQAQNVKEAISAQTKQAQNDYDNAIRRQHIIQEISQASFLTPSIADTLIKRVLVFPDNRIEIEYAVQDMFTLT